MDLYKNRQVYTSPSARNILTPNSCLALATKDDLPYHACGVVGDVRYGYYDENGKFYRNVVSGICLMFPKIYDPELNAIDSIDSHLWVFADKMQAYDPSAPNESTMFDESDPLKRKIYLGDTLLFKFNANTYQSGGLERHGVGAWTPCSAHMIYHDSSQKAKKASKVPRQLLKRFNALDVPARSQLSSPFQVRPKKLALRKDIEADRAYLWSIVNERGVSILRKQK